MKQLVKTTAAFALQLWIKVLETASGGFTLDITGLTVGAVIKGGTPFTYDESTRKAKPLKTAKLTSAATNTDVTYNVEKGHLFVVGDYLANVVGGKAYAITVINTSNAAYDVLTVGTTLAVTLAIGDGLFQSSATGASAAALNVTPKGLLYEDTEVFAGSDLAIVLRGTVYARRCPIPAAAKASTPLIIFSDSY